jgi:hypothetical protein
MIRTALIRLTVALLALATLSIPATSLAAATEDATKARANGARWLVQHQNTDGGWGAGAHGNRSAGAASDVATTAISVMALLRDARGSGAHASAIERGVLFVVSAVEKSPLEGARLDGPQGTQPQYKLGQNVDTHFAALLLGEVSETMSAKVEKRLQPAYDKALTKVANGQQSDGSFDSQGWATVLSSSVAAQSLYTAKKNGKVISDDVLARNQDFQRKLVDADTGRFDASKGAGVDLYAAASSLRGNQQAAEAPSSPEARERAVEATEVTADSVRRETERMIRGFGSVGGEEMLSYMMISDSLAEERGEDWTQWQQRIGTHLAEIQNTDGSWSGHHCITSTPFVTAAAVMTLGAGPAL